MNWNDIAKKAFFFDTMVTPKIITFVYWLMLLLVLVGGISVMFMPYYGGFFKGLGVWIVGAVAARIWCELLMVLFKINEHMARIAESSAPALPAQHDADVIGVSAPEANL